MSDIDKRALREAAERAGQNDWEYVYTSDLSAPGRGYITVGGAEAIYCLNKAAGGVKQSENVLRYIAAASPETMLALLNEIAELEQRHCGTALLEREEMHTKTLGRMLDELDAKDRRIAELELKLEAAEKRIAELGAKLEIADKLQDSAFRHGLQHGFSLGQTDNQAGFEQAIEAYGQQWKGE
ncbi:ead/Ea22-like family protein [Enterobacter cloacae]|uniref:Ead/Ea22-like family protein n=1 Tax=Enterobacter cloacae TaxID=550 RepID=A0AB37VN18_ENTCL|nr:ead/Ea22-like family protein [Enterobacter cloacae]RWT84808.1 ead/Ea22-like family protein [Enterobacter cloacae]